MNNVFSARLDESSSFLKAILVVSYSRFGSVLDVTEKLIGQKPEVKLQSTNENREKKSIDFTFLCACLMAHLFNKDGVSICAAHNDKSRYRRPECRNVTEK